MGMRRDPDQKPSASSDAVCDLSVSAADIQSVVEYITTDTWEDGSSRETSTVTAFSDDGVVKLCLNDRDRERTCWVSGRTLLEALIRLEEALRSGVVDWRRAGKPKGRR